MLSVVQRTLYTEAGSIIAATLRSSALTAEGRSVSGAAPMHDRELVTATDQTDATLRDPRIALAFGGARVGTTGASR